MTVQPLIVSYSGIRGMVGGSLTSEVAFRFGRAFVRLLAEHGAAYAEYRRKVPMLLPALRAIRRSP